MADKFLVRTGDEEVSMELRHENGQAFVRVEGDDVWKKATLDRVGETGLYLLMIDNKPLPCTMGHHGFARVLFTVVKADMVLLHGFVKKSASTPKDDLELARTRMKEAKK